MAPRHVLAAALGHLAHLSRSARPRLQPAAPEMAYTFGNLPLEKLYTWEVATWEIVTWEVALGKTPLGKCL